MGTGTANPKVVTAAASGVYRSSVLLGRDHPTLGAVEVVEVTPTLAIAISAGRFPKAYPHQEPNEDAVFAATDGSTTVLAVADGHGGGGASHAVIEAIERTSREGIEAPSLIDRLVAASQDAAVRESGRTALSLCVLRRGTATSASFGDSAILRLGRWRGSIDQGDSDFLPGTKDVRRTQMEVPKGSAVAVVSDGIVDFSRRSSGWLKYRGGGEATVVARRLVEGAFDGGAGDNLAIAIGLSII